MTFREATVDDVEAIQLLTASLGYEISLPELEKNIKTYKQTGFIQVALIQENIVGYISALFIPLFHAKGKMCRITALSVHPDYKRKGVGKQLVNVVERWCIQNNCNYIEVTSGGHRAEEAHQFYHHLGYDAYTGKRFLKRMTLANPNTNADH